MENDAIRRTNRVFFIEPSVIYRGWLEVDGMQTFAFERKLGTIGNSSYGTVENDWKMINLRLRKK